MEKNPKNEEIFVGNQENFLQKTALPEQKIKRIDDVKNPNDESFVQFDMFEQSMKVVKTPSHLKETKIEQYQNKYETLSSLDEIEPQKTSETNIKEESKKTEINEDFRLKNDKNVAKAENKQEKISQENSDDIKNDAHILSPDERIELPQQEEIFAIQQPAKQEGVKEIKQSLEQNNNIEENPENSNDPKEEHVFENNDYKVAIGKLYNNSQLSDPYEKNKFRSFKEIFPSSSLDDSNEQEQKEQNSKIIDKNTESNINSDDLDSLSSLFSLQDIYIKSYKPKNAKTQDVYTDKSRLNMFALIITSLLMIAETLFCYFIIRNFASSNFNSVKIIYYIACALAVCLLTVGILENTFDKYKLVVLKPDFKKSVTKRLLAFMFCVILTFAICLAFGMSGLSEKKFLSFWILPTVLSTNFVTYYFIYYTLFKTKKFNR